MSIKYLQSKSGLGKDKIQKFVQMIQKKIEEASQVDHHPDIVNGNNNNNTNNGNGNVKEQDADE